MPLYLKIQHKLTSRIIDWVQDLCSGFYSLFPTSVYARPIAHDTSITRLVPSIWFATSTWAEIPNAIVRILMWMTGLMIQRKLTSQIIDLALDLYLGSWLNMNILQYGCIFSNKIKESRFQQIFENIHKHNDNEINENLRNFFLICRTYINICSYKFLFLLCLLNWKIDILWFPSCSSFLL